MKLHFDVDVSRLLKDRRYTNMKRANFRRPRTGVGWEGRIYKYHTVLTQLCKLKFISFLKEPTVLCLPIFIVNK